MLCCVGLIGGVAVGQYLGGPWTAIAPAAGFAIGLVADMKFMKGHHKESQRPRDVELSAERDPVPVSEMHRGTKEKPEKRDEPRHERQAVAGEAAPHG
jgi:hypothetical protein